MNREDGFTLLELLVSLAILALVAVLAAPMVTKRGMSEAEITAGNVQAILIAARETSLAENRETRVHFDLENRAIKTDRFEQAMTERVTVRTTTEATNYDGLSRIRFFPDGGASGGRLLVSDERSTFEVAVNWATGAVTLRELR